MEVKDVLKEFFVYDNNVVKFLDKRKSKNLFTDEELFRWLGNYSDEKDFDWNKKTREEGIKEWKEEMKLKKNDKSEVEVSRVELYMKHIMQKFNISFTDGGKFLYNGILTDDVTIESIFENDIWSWNLENPNLRISVPEVKGSLEIMRIEKNNNALIKLIKALEYNKENEKELNEFLELTHKTFDIAEDINIFKMIMCHWMWMVKRRIVSKNTINQIFINFYGRGGTGKTFFVKLFTEPFKNNRVLNAKIETFDDERRIPELSQNYVHFLDELSGEKRVYIDTDLAQFKQIITADSPITYRQLATHNSPKVMSKTSLIGCSNYHIYDTINDSKGMRRFFEFNIRIASHGYKKEDFERLAKICDLAWKGIDDDIDTGYLNFASEIGEKISNIQDTYARKESFDLWLDSVEFVPGKINGKTAYDNYMQYCVDEGLEHKIKAIQTFYSRMLSLGYEKITIHGYAYLNTNIIKKNVTTEDQPSTKNFIDSLQNLGIQTQDDLSHTRAGKNLSNKLGGIS